MDSDKPFFRFHPGAYERKSVFEASSDPCDVCGRPCVWRYVGSIYTAGEKPVVCARCLADGRLAAHLDDAHFQLHDCNLPDADPALAAEVMQRTPGFSTFNPFPWPVLEGKPLAFIGYGDDDELWSDPAAQAAIRQTWRTYLGKELDGPTPYALVFREPDGQRWLAEIDLD